MRRVLVGAYTRKEPHVDGKAAGIYTLQLGEDGSLTQESCCTGIDNPSFLVPTPDGAYLYSVSEIDDYDGARVGGVAALSLAADGAPPVALNSRPSQGTGPCHVDYVASTRRVVVANYGSGTVAAYDTKPDGSLGSLINAIVHSGSGPNAQRQAGPHAHSINVSPDERYALVADLGIDRIIVYDISNATGALVEKHRVAVTPGAGPRHLTFHPSLPRVYLINELDSSVTVFAYDAASGALTELERFSTLPEGYQGANSCADIHVTPNGRFLYGSNRGHNSLAIFAIDKVSGRLTPIGHQSTMGKTPRNFAIDPTGALLLAANQDTNTVVTFHIHAEDGTLHPTGHSIDVPSPVCLRIL